jgi:hypothetical protein
MFIAIQCGFYNGADIGRTLGLATLPKALREPEIVLNAWFDRGKRLSMAALFRLNAVWIFIAQALNIGYSDTKVKSIL